MWINITIFSKCIYLCSNLKGKRILLLKKRKAVLAIRFEVNREWYCIQRNLKTLDGKKKVVYKSQSYIQKKNTYRCLKVFFVNMQTVRIT